MAKTDITFVKRQTVPSDDFVSRKGRSAARIVDGLIDFVAARAPPMKIGNVPAHGTRDGRRPSLVCRLASNDAWTAACRAHSDSDGRARRAAAFLDKPQKTSRFAILPDGDFCVPTD